MSIMILTQGKEIKAMTNLQKRQIVKQLKQAPNALITLARKEMEIELDGLSWKWLAIKISCDKKTAVVIATRHDVYMRHYDMSINRLAAYAMRGLK